MGKEWVFPGHDVDGIARLERLAGVSTVVAQLLLQRGLHEPALARRFLEAKLSDLRDPLELPGVDEASERIYSAIQAGRRVVVFGDYDADGMSATALLVRCLQAVRADVSYYVPNRMGEGYGLSGEALEKLAERGASLVVTVDCGIGSVEPAWVARRLGLELIITDHHRPGRELPEAAVLVHPALPGSSYPFSGLCGAGIAFKLAWAVCQRASQAKRVSPHLRSLLLSALGLAAIGTVADVVPLVDENRILVRHGLSTLKAQPTVGVAALMRVCGLDQKSALTSEDIGFTLGPRLNAAGRLGQAQLGVELLASDSPERAQTLAEYIDQLNNSRESLERSVYLAAHRQLKELYDPQDESAFVLASHGWHVGVIGIVAGRLAERYHRPVVLISLDDAGGGGTGSGRSIPGVNLHEAFAGCTETLVAHGGHAAAAGLRIEPSMIDAFRHQFCELVVQQCGPTMPTAQLRIDAEAGLSQLTWETMQQMEHLAPFGCGNPRPLLCASGVELVDRPQCIGRGERHLAVRLRQGPTVLRAMAFHRAPEWLEPLGSQAGRIDIAFRPTINEFRGRRSVEAHLVDWRPSVLAAAHLSRSSSATVS